MSVLSREGSPPIDFGPLFEVFVVGTRSSGKTTFLSALYKQLSVQDNSRSNFYLEASNSTEREYLLSIYDRVANINAEWPAGNRDITRLEFRCLHANGKASIPLFRFGYYDFPGGLLNGSDETEFVRRSTDQAHSIIALIDGQKVFDALCDQITTDMSLDHELSLIITALQPVVNRPIQFIITKADLLKEFHFQDVVKLLLKSSSMSNFVSQRAHWRAPLHVIHVSAVGDNFASWDGQNGMRKLQNGSLNPYHLDLTIGYVLTDQLCLLRYPGASLAVHGKAAVLSGLSAILNGFGLAKPAAAEIGPMLSAYFGIPFRVELALALLEKLNKSVTRSAENLRREIDGLTRKATDRKSAVEAITLVQGLLRNDYYTRFPESELTASVHG